MSFFLEQRQDTCIYATEKDGKKNPSQTEMDIHIQNLPQNVNNTVNKKKLVKINKLISELILLSKMHCFFPKR